MLKRITAATDLVVSVERAKARLAIDSTDFDDDIQALIAAAQAALESHASIILGESDWEYRGNYWQEFWPGHPLHWTLDRGFTSPFPLLRIPAGPIRDVTAITYLDETNSEQTIDQANWSWLKTDSGADVVFSANYTLPTLSSNPQAVRVAFTAGFNADPPESGDDPDLNLPPQAEMAVLFLVGHWFRTRESVGNDQPYDVPQTFDYLAAQLRVYR